jgi:YidC/Oxa1 family membrane protein insertase
MTPLFNLVAGILAAFYSAVPNYALAIILLTILVMAITTPLTLKSTRSMMMMQQLQPEMKRIQARFKDDRQRANEEMLKFYKENNINPLGGCIPLLVQMPVFFFLYEVLRGLTRRVSDTGFSIGFGAGQSAAGVSLTTAPTDLLPFDPAFLDHSSAMYQSLSHTTTMAAPPLNVDLSQSLTQAWSQGVWAALPYVVLIAIVAFTSFYQQRQIQGRNPNQQINPQTQTMMKIMPVILPVISLSLPAGLVLYFAVSNTWRVGLQAFISRSIYGIKRREADEAGGGKAGKLPRGGRGDGDGSGNGAKGLPKGKGGPAAASGRRNGNGKGRARQEAEPDDVDDTDGDAELVATSGSRRNGKPSDTNGKAANGKVANGNAANGKAANGADRSGTNRRRSSGSSGSGGSSGSSGERNGKPSSAGSKPSVSRSSGNKGNTKAANGRTPGGSSRGKSSSGGRSQTGSSSGPGSTKKPSGSSGSDRSSRSNRSSSSSSDSGSSSPPALQPRARRPKKR